MIPATSVLNIHLKNDKLKLCLLKKEIFIKSRMNATDFVKDNESSDNFDLFKTNTKYNKKFHTQTANYKVIFKNVPSEFIYSVFYMNIIMQMLVKSLLKECEKRDKIKIIIDHPVLTEPIELI